MDLLPRVLLVLGFGFLLANLRLFFQFVRFLRLRSSAVLTWPGRKPPLYPLLLVLGAVLSALIIYKLAVLQQHPKAVFGESMMLLYYAWLLPLSLRIGRGFYEDGIWADSAFIPYDEVGGISWREGEHQVTLLISSRLRNLARRLIVPGDKYGAARRLLRDKIGEHAIQLGGALDLGAHDERDNV